MKPRGRSRFLAYHTNHMQTKKISFSYDLFAQYDFPGSCDCVNIFLPKTGQFVTSQIITVLYLKQSTFNRGFEKTSFRGR